MQWTAEKEQKGNVRQNITQEIKNDKLLSYFGKRTPNEIRKKLRKQPQSDIFI